ncbi:hypothetical protein D3C81_1078150 [compost metagenome]
MLGRARAVQLPGEAAGQLFLAQQREQLFKVQLLGLPYPAEGQQRLQRQRSIADFGVVEPIAAKQLAFAHHHAHHQSLGWRLQLTEGTDEGQFLVIEQVLVALFDPQHDLAEVMQVVERVVDGMGDHGRKSDGGNRHCLYIQIPLHDKRRGSRHNQPRVQGLHCSPRSVHACSVAPAIPPASTLALPMGACSSRKYATAEHSATTALIMNAVVNEPEYWMLKPVAIGATEPAM